MIEMEVRLVCLEAFFVLIFQAGLVNIILFSEREVDFEQIKWER